MRNPLDWFRALSRAKRATAAGLVMIPVIVLASAESCTSSSSQTSQDTGQSMSNKIFNSAQRAVPYPFQQMQSLGWTEDKLLSEHLLRESDSQEVRYVYLFTMTGTLMATYTIKGMVFDPNSQMTETTDTNCNSSGQAPSCVAVNSVGDNGTFGPEAGNAAFFTTGGTEVQIPAGWLWVAADSPLQLTTKPVITFDSGTSPPINHSGTSGVGGH